MTRHSKWFPINNLLNDFKILGVPVRSASHRAMLVRDWSSLPWSHHLTRASSTSHREASVVAPGTYSSAVWVSGNFPNNWTGTEWDSEPSWCSLPSENKKENCIALWENVLKHDSTLGQKMWLPGVWSHKLLKEVELW